MEQGRGHQPAGGDDHRLVVVLGDGREVPLCRVADLGRPDLSAVDALARLQLAARRQGWSIRLTGVCRELGSLLDLCGLAEVVPAGSPPGDRPDT
jgi:ABC-type transporter Mla MlaB component